MNKERLIEGLQNISEGINILITELGAEAPTTEVGSKTKKAKGNVAKKSEEVMNEPVESEETVKGSLTREDLDSMTYNNLKKLAKDMGVSATGNRETITARLLNEEVEVPKKEVEVEEATKEEVAESEDPVKAQVLEAVEDLTNEELADLLSDVGVSPKGKRETLIDKIVKAVSEGLISLDDEDEDEEDTSEDIDEDADLEEDDEVDADEEDSDEDDEEDDEDDGVNDLSNPDMTEERREAIKAKDKELRKLFKSKKLKVAKMVDFLQDFYETDEDLEEDMDAEDILDTYIDAVCRLIDDDGDLVEEGAYMVNDLVFCCGREAQYLEDEGIYACEHCGNEYEADEE